MNESKYLDVTGWIDSLEELDIDVEHSLPAVAESVTRVERLNSILAHHRKSFPEINVSARQLAVAVNLDDTAAALEKVNLLASSYDTAHRDRVTEILERATDIAMGESSRAFRRSDILAAIRPTFDAIAQRIVDAPGLIPQGTLNLEDAARLGCGSAYMQLETDLAAWKAMGELITSMLEDGALKTDARRYAIEYMVDDVDAYKSMGITNKRQHATAIAVGRANLHHPTGPAYEPAHENDAREAAYLASEADKDARANLNLARG